MPSLSEFHPNLSLLTWGISVEDMQSLHNKYPHCVVSYCAVGFPCLCIDQLVVHNFEGDCGTLYIHGTNNASDDSLAFLAEFASLSGFSKILATICERKPEATVTKFLNKGWEVVKKSKSNRNPAKEHYIMLLSIDCVHKGY